MTVNGIEITAETVLKTREHFAQIHRDCIAGAIAGDFQVNDLDRYTAWQSEMLMDSIMGRTDHTLTFAQRALWIQTGECVPMLS